MGVLKGGDEVMGKTYEDYMVLKELLCVSGYRSVDIVEGVCIRDCRRIGVCRVGTVN
jgi:hypothetical protein